MAKVSIEFDTLDELDEFYAEAKKKFVRPEKIWPVNDDMDGVEFERLMTEKNYLCRSFVAKEGLCKKLGIRRKKQGSKWKYNRADVIAAPIQKLKRRNRRKSREEKRVQFVAQTVVQAQLKAGNNQ